MPEPARSPRGLLDRVTKLRHTPLLTGGLVAAAFLVTFIGAGASPVGPTPISEVLGLGGDHGAAVSDAVHDAKDGLEDGDKVGSAVSTAACTAAQDDSTKPPGAQSAPGQQDREPKDCTHSSNADSEEEENGDEPDDPEDGDDEELNHGQSVSKAVHDAKDGLEDGEKVGSAVSTAACIAAHDDSMKPPGAQNAPGQQNREPKDCTHSSDDTGEDEEEESASSTHGKESAPGQKKKNAP